MRINGCQEGGETPQLAAIKVIMSSNSTRNWPTSSGCFACGIKKKGDKKRLLCYDYNIPLGGILNTS